MFWAGNYGPRMTGFFIRIFPIPVETSEDFDITN